MAARPDVHRAPYEISLGKPGLIFLIGLEQHPEIDRYVTEFLDNHRFAKYADIVFRSAISNSADVACRMAQNLRLQCRVHRVRTFDSVSGHDLALVANKGQRYEIAGVIIRGTR